MKKEKLNIGIDDQKSGPFFASRTGIFVFLFLLIFQPHKMSFYALRPSDGWLLLCLILQTINGYYGEIEFRKRYLIKNFGFFLGLIAISGTILQALYACISLNDSFIFNFFRFFRFLLIFKFIENTIVVSGNQIIRQLLPCLSVIGLLILILSFLEFYGVQPIKDVMISLYYARPEAELEGYIHQVERLAGIMGNPNTTALLLLITIIYPVTILKNKLKSPAFRLLSFLYITAVLYVLLVMTGSRSSILTMAIILLIYLVASLRNTREYIITGILLILFTIAGLTTYKQLNRKIEVQERITDSFNNTSFELSLKGFAKWTGRYELWNYRFRTFRNDGNQLSLLVGIGYTIPDQDYADNGFLSTFLNNGLIGLILKLLLYYYFLYYGLYITIQRYRSANDDIYGLVISLVTFSMFLWEFTADMTDHYKLGQLFYMFLSVSMIQTNPGMFKGNRI